MVYLTDLEYKESFMVHTVLLKRLNSTKHEDWKSKFECVSPFCLKVCIFPFSNISLKNNWWCSIKYKNLNCCLVCIALSNSYRLMGVSMKSFSTLWSQEGKQQKRQSREPDMEIQLVFFALTDALCPGLSTTILVRWNFQGSKDNEESNNKPLYRVYREMYGSTSTFPLKILWNKVERWISELIDESHTMKHLRQLKY